MNHLFSGSRYRNVSTVRRYDGNVTWMKQYEGYLIYIIQTNIEFAISETFYDFKWPSNGCVDNVFHVWETTFDIYT